MNAAVHYQCNKEKVNNSKNCHILNNDADHDVPPNNIHDPEPTLELSLLK
jgi:hypothetical protein